MLLPHPNRRPSVRVDSGHTHKLQYKPTEQCSTKKKNRKQNVTWFTPLYSANVKSNIGRDFLKLIDTSFPTSNPLHKLFTRQTVKLSYNCMPSMAKAVARHNMQILSKDQRDTVQQPGCNCQGGPAVCPVQGKCQTKSVVYRATVTDTGSGQVETYTGVTGNTFKERYNGHKSDIRHRKDRHKTCLANPIWDMKDEGRNYEIQWDLVEQAPTFNPTTRKCRVCLKEKNQILYNHIGSTLNKRNEIFNTCRHRTQKLLENVVT